ncbi:MAG: hypothetical protein AAFS10_00180 [Myxococcota bacterium]
MTKPKTSTAPPEMEAISTDAEPAPTEAKLASTEAELASTEARLVSTGGALKMDGADTAPPSSTGVKGDLTGTEFASTPVKPSIQNNFGSTSTHAISTGTGPAPYTGGTDTNPSPLRSVSIDRTPDATSPDAAWTSLDGAAIWVVVAWMAIPVVAVAIALEIGLGHMGTEEEIRWVERALIDQVTLTPSGQPPVEGVAPHHAVDRRHAPNQPPMERP